MQIAIILSCNFFMLWNCRGTEATFAYLYLAHSALIACEDTREKTNLVKDMQSINVLFAKFFNFFQQQHTVVCDVVGSDEEQGLFPLSDVKKYASFVFLPFFPFKRLHAIARIKLVTFISHTSAGFFCYVFLFLCKMRENPEAHQGYL